MHPLFFLSSTYIHMYMKIHTYVCVLLVFMHLLPTSWFLLREEVLLKVTRKKKLSLLFYPEKIRKCPKSQEGAFRAENRTLLLHMKGLCPSVFLDFKGVI